ncbi:histone acetylation protein 2 [Diplocarpon rosae]|nr:histone acetylation protein 2 [Diplocarpon rosae]
MAPSPLQQRRTHNILLFQKLLNLRDSASPFTLVLDSLEQSGGPVVREFARRATASRSKIIFISFETLCRKVPFETDVFITARGKAFASLRTEIITHLPTLPTAAPNSSSPWTKYLLVIDTLHPLSATHAQHLSPFLSSLLISPQISMLATYHTDIPLPRSSSPYSPTPLTTLLYLATAILTVYSVPQVLARKRARDKSLQEPAFGIQEGREGVIVGLQRSGNNEEQGVVVNMEIRRRSGRGVIENFVLLPPNSTNHALQSVASPRKLSALSDFVLLDDHPLYASNPSGEASIISEETDNMETTFNLGLTEKQKRDRENVVLPYFDAQKEGGAAGPGEGGRILYDMGAEDREDFDDEEDEI